MTNPTALRDLIARIEAAEEPRRKDFCEAYEIVFGRLPDFSIPTDWLDESEVLFARCVLHKAWTSAAELFVPEDAFSRVGNDGEGPEPWRFRADVLVPQGPNNPALADYHSTTDHRALALLAASLKAHLAIIEQGDTQ